MEEVDELFDKGLYAWQFRYAKTTGVGAMLHEIEQGNYGDGKAREEGEVDPGGCAREEIEDIT